MLFLRSTHSSKNPNPLVLVIVIINMTFANRNISQIKISSFPSCCSCNFPICCLAVRDQLYAIDQRRRVISPSFHPCELISYLHIPIRSFKKETPHFRQIKRSLFPQSLGLYIYIGYRHFFTIDLIDKTRHVQTDWDWAV